MIRRLVRKQISRAVTLSLIINVINRFQDLLWLKAVIRQCWLHLLLFLKIGHNRSFLRLVLFLISIAKLTILTISLMVSESKTLETKHTIVIAQAAWIYHHSSAKRPSFAKKWAVVRNSATSTKANLADSSSKSTTSSLTRPSNKQKCSASITQKTPTGVSNSFLAFLQFFAQLFR